MEPIVGIQELKKLRSFLFKKLQLFSPSVLSLFTNQSMRIWPQYKNTLE
jgi:hypothetical protein